MEVTSTIADLKIQHVFITWLKLEDGVYIQSDDFTTKEVDANLDRASLVNRLENK